MINSFRNDITIAEAGCCPVAIKLVSVIVKKYAIGSLLPLSSSQHRAQSAFECNAPVSQDGEYCSCICSRYNSTQQQSFKNGKTKNPVNKKSYGKRRKKYAQGRQGNAFPQHRLYAFPVGIQPAGKKNKVQRDDAHQLCKCGIGSKWIPPIPSEPASTPTTRKKINVGTPSLLVVFPAITLISSNNEPINKIFPASINMVIIFGCNHNARPTGHGNCAKCVVKKLYKCMGPYRLTNPVMMVVVYASYRG